MKKALILIPFVFLLFLCVSNNEKESKEIEKSLEWIKVKDFYSTYTILYPGESTTVTLTLLNTYDKINGITAYLFGGGDIAILTAQQQTMEGEIPKGSEVSFVWKIKAPELSFAGITERYMKARINYTIYQEAWKDIMFYTNKEENVNLESGYSYGPLDISITLQNDRIRFYKDEASFNVNFKISNVGSGEVKDNKVKQLLIIYPEDLEAISIDENKAVNEGLLTVKDGEKILKLNESLGYYYSNLLGYNNEKEFQIRFRKQKEEGVKVERIKVYVEYEYVIYTPPLYLQIKGS